MKKKKTAEEIFRETRERELSNLQFHLPFIPEPTIHYAVGDQVIYGNFSNAYIKEIFYDGKAYGLQVPRTRNDENYPLEDYRVTSWMGIRPLHQGDSDFSRSESLCLRFNNTTVESLLHRSYFFGVDLSPYYQREYIWDNHDKDLLLNSVFNHVNIGQFVYVHKDYTKDIPLYEILDGKQRLTTLMQYYENRFPYREYYFRDLSWKDQNTFLQHPVAYADLDTATEKEILQVFLMLNQTGRKPDPLHLKKVQDLYIKLCV